jgi:hypothetical protein
MDSKLLLVNAGLALGVLILLAIDFFIRGINESQRLAFKRNCRRLLSSIRNFFFYQR